MKKIYIISLLAFCVHNAVAQTNTFPSTGAVGIGTTSPNASSLLEIKSTTKGILIPRMTKGKRDSIATPATGLLIFQTNSTPGFYYYSGTAWTAVTPKSNGWSLTGNAGTDPQTNFIGTTDTRPLVFRVNNTKAGYIDYNPSGANTAFGYQTLNVNGGFNNTAIGYKALSSNTTGYYNTAIGTSALYKNTTGYVNVANGVSALYSNDNGDNNIAIGFSALYSNVSGSRNVALGSHALNGNKDGTFNIAVGSDALYSNTSGEYNIATGRDALYYNTTGINNTASGWQALYSNISGNNNIAIGTFSLLSNTSASDLIAIGRYALSNNGIGASQSYEGTANTAIGSAGLYANTIGYNNSAVGSQSLYFNDDGYNNVAFGVQALQSNVHGIGNTAVGVAADVNNNSWENATAIGYYAVSTGSNQVRLGNSSVTSIGGYANWTNISDGRVKKNIKQNVPGLAFINKLRPVTYNLDLDAADKIVQHSVLKEKDSKIKPPLPWESDARKAKEHVVYTGFVAQDVERAAKSLNYDFSGVDAAKNEHDLYGLRYAEFVVPLVKAVQELSKQNDSLKAENENLEQRVTRLEELMNIKKMTLILSGASLEQNIPNPFTNSTVINYTLPQSIVSAQIIITDKSGRTLKTVKISGSGIGNLKVDASTLAAGAYQYSLIVDAKLVDTKQMIVN